MKYMDADGMALLGLGAGTARQERVVVAREVVLLVLPQEGERRRPARRQAAHPGAERDGAGAVVVGRIKRGELVEHFRENACIF